MSMFCMKMQSTLNAVYLQCWMYPLPLLRPILCGKIFLLVLWKLYKVMCVISEFYLHVCKYSISKFLFAVILCPFAQFWKVTELLEHSLLLSQSNIYIHTNILVTCFVYAHVSDWWCSLSCLLPQALPIPMCMRSSWYTLKLAEVLHVIDVFATFCVIPLIFLCTWEHLLHWFLLWLMNGRPEELLHGFTRRKLCCSWII